MFGNAITASSTVTLDASSTVGYLVFNDDNNYTLAPAAAQVLTMAVAGGSAQINTSNSGSVTISAAVALSNDLSINRNSSGTLTFSNASALTGTTKNITVGGSGNTAITGIITTTTGNLTMRGTGNLTLTGANTYTGKTVINAGAVVIDAETRLGANRAAATTGQLTLNGGTLRTATNTVTIDDTRRGITLNSPLCASRATRSSTSATAPLPRSTRPTCLSPPAPRSPSPTGSTTATISTPRTGVAPRSTPAAWGIS